MDEVISVPHRCTVRRYGLDFDTPNSEKTNEEPLLSLPSRIGNELCIANQQKETVDPQLIQNLHDTIISKKYNDAINNHAAAAIAALFTENAIFVTDTVGPLYGRQAIEKFYADDFKGWQPKNHTSTTDPHSARMLGPDNLTRAGVWSETGKGKNGEDVPIKGYWSEIDTRQGDAWKICFFTGSATPDSWALIYKSFGLPPAATPSPTASPSGQ
jgi:uncharacterized protein (TIGR02246 family)